MPRAHLFVFQELYEAVVRDGFGPLLRGEPCPPLAVWAPFHDELCKDVRRVWQKFPDRSVVVSFAAYPVLVRSYIRSLLADLPLQFVVLNDTNGGSVQRKFDQVAAAAAEAGQSLQQFLEKFGGEYTAMAVASDEDCKRRLLEIMASTQNGFEPAVEGEFGVQVDRTVTAADVLERVCDRFGIVKLNRI
jgi:hypothetical protein